MSTINIIDEQYMTEDMRRAYRTAKELGLFDEPRPTLTDKERAYGQGLAAGTAIVAAERAVIEAAKKLVRFIAKKNAVEGSYSLSSRDAVLVEFIETVDAMESKR